MSQDSISYQPAIMVNCDSIKPKRERILAQIDEKFSGGEHAMLTDLANNMKLTFKSDIFGKQIEVFEPQTVTFQSLVEYFSFPKNYTYHDLIKIFDSLDYIQYEITDQYRYKRAGCKNFDKCRYSMPFFEEIMISERGIEFTFNRHIMLLPAENGQQLLRDYSEIDMIIDAMKEEEKRQRKLKRKK
jgi:hypothetical protein